MERTTGDLIRIYRKKAGKTQTWLAKKVKVRNPQLISAAELGKAPFPIRRAQRAIAVLGIPRGEMKAAYLYERLLQIEKYI